jgi:hypothetical protein
MWLGVGGFVLTSGVMLVLLPPFQGPDENAHFQTALRSFGRADAQALEALLAHAPVQGLAFEVNARVNTELLRGEAGATVPEPPAVYSSILSYPSVLATALLAPHTQSLAEQWSFFYACRALGLLLTLAVLLWLARQRTLPMSLLAVAALPLFAQQSTVISADTLANGATLVAFALCVQRRDLWLLSAACALAALAKPNMIATFVLPASLIVERWIRERRWRTLSVFAASLVGAASFAWFVLFGFVVRSDDRATLQVRSLHTWDGLVAFGRALAHRWGQLGHYKDWAGPLGWLDTPLGSPHIMVLEILLIVGIVVDVLDHALATHAWARLRTSRLLGFALTGLPLLFGVFGLACLALYVFMTPVGAPWVDGVQTRYLFPAVLALALASWVLEPAEVVRPMFARVTFSIASGVWAACLVFSVTELTHTLLARYY